MPLKGFVMNNGFELNPNSVYSPLANWNFPGGAKHQIINEEDAPEGFQYLKVTDRSESSDVEQWLHLPSDFHDDWLIEIRYWAKFDYQDSFNGYYFKVMILVFSSYFINCCKGQNN